MQIGIVLYGAACNVWFCYMSWVILVIWFCILCAKSIAALEEDMLVKSIQK